MEYIDNFSTHAPRHYRHGIERLPDPEKWKKIVEPPRTWIPVKRLGSGKDEEKLWKLLKSLYGIAPVNRNMILIVN